MPTRLLLSAGKRERSALSARRRRKERSRSSSAARARARYTSRGSRTRLRGPPRGCSSGLRGTGPNGLSSAASQDISPPEPRRGRERNIQTPQEGIPMTWALIGASRACGVTRAFHIAGSARLSAPVTVNPAESDVGPVSAHHHGCGMDGDTSTAPVRPPHRRPEHGGRQPRACMGGAGALGA